MDPLGLGVIGCGNMGASLAKGAANLEIVRLVCASDIDEKKGRDLAGQAATEVARAAYRSIQTREPVALPFEE